MKGKDHLRGGGGELLGGGDLTGGGGELLQAAKHRQVAAAGCSATEPFLQDLSGNSSSCAAQTLPAFCLSAGASTGAPQMRQHKPAACLVAALLARAAEAQARMCLQQPEGPGHDPARAGKLAAEISWHGAHTLAGEDVGKGTRQGTWQQVGGSWLQAGVT